MNHQPFKLGLIGAGKRGRTVYNAIYNAAPQSVQLLNVLDPSDHAFQQCFQLNGTKNLNRSLNLSEIINQSNIDAFIISSPNSEHLEPTLSVIQKNKLVYLEKPITTTIDDLNLIKNNYETHQSRVLIGFVLRYTKFYKKVKEFISTGRLGKILHFHADEHMGLSLTSHLYLRGWRKDLRYAGPLILEKCCHDIDLILWLIEKKCTHLSAFSHRSIFNLNTGQNSHCYNCTDQECLYRIEKEKRNQIQEVDYKRVITDTCVYNSDISIDDHTSVLMNFEGGTHVTFNVSMGAGKSGRSIKIIGSKGSLEGHFEEGHLKFYPLDHKQEREEYTSLYLDGGHGGGDLNIGKEFFKLWQNPETKPFSSIKEAYRSNFLSLKIHEAAQKQKVFNFNYSNE